MNEQNQTYLDFLQSREAKMVDELLKIRHEIRQVKWKKMKRKLVNANIREKLDISGLRI